MSQALCGSIIKSRRGLLAFAWSVVIVLSFLAFITALIFSTTASNDDYYNRDGNENNQGGNNNNNNNNYQDEPQIAITSRAMAFAALWTSVLSLGMSVLGTVVLGWQSPTGQYYICCPGNVHRTSSLSIGVFIGALLMYANLTLVCSVIFGEFDIRDYGEDREKEREEENYQEQAIERSSLAFSVMCLFLTILYAGFAALVFIFHESIVAETIADAREEALQPSPEIGVNLHPSGGYVGGAFEGNRQTYVNQSSNGPGTLA